VSLHFADAECAIREHSDYNDAGTQQSSLVPYLPPVLPVRKAATSTKASVAATPTTEPRRRRHGQGQGQQEGVRVPTTPNALIQQLAPRMERYTDRPAPSLSAQAARRSLWPANRQLRFSTKHLRYMEVHTTMQRMDNVLREAGSHFDAELHVILNGSVRVDRVPRITGAGRPFVAESMELLPGDLVYHPSGLAHSLTAMSKPAAGFFNLRWTSRSAAANAAANAATRTDASGDVASSKADQSGDYRPAVGFRSGFGAGVTSKTIYDGSTNGLAHLGIHYVRLAPSEKPGTRLSGMDSDFFILPLEGTLNLKMPLDDDSGGGGARLLTAGQVLVRSLVFRASFRFASFRSVSFRFIVADAVDGAAVRASHCHIASLVGWRRRCIVRDHRVARQGYDGPGQVKI
jgi:mannose-6-phosphate isomerase-like protein (cupin superfamily)